MPCHHFITSPPKYHNHQNRSCNNRSQKHLTGLRIRSDLKPYWMTLPWRHSWPLHRPHLWRVSSRWKCVHGRLWALHWHHPSSPPPHTDSHDSKPWHTEKFITFIIPALLQYIYGQQKNVNMQVKFVFNTIIILKLHWHLRLNEIIA